MAINAIHGAMTTATTAVTQPSLNDTKTQLAEKFDKLMTLGTPAIKEATDIVTQTGNDNPLMAAVKGLSSDQSMATRAPALIAPQQSGFSHNPSPEAMLGGQILLGKAIIEVDLVAKTAGSLSQSINKLVNMQ